MTIHFNDFKKLDLRVGQIITAEKIDGSDKLLKLKVAFGELGERQIVAGLAQHYSADALINTQAVFVLNLEPRILKGVESQGMILAADNNNSPIIIKPANDVLPGSMVK